MRPGRPGIGGRRSGISIHALPHRMRLGEGADEVLAGVISIHALPHRMRRLVQNGGNGTALFQSTHSLTECDAPFLTPCRVWAYFNPRTPSQNATAKITNFFLFPSISYPYCTPPLSKTQPLYFHRTIFPHKLPIFQCESPCIFMST